MSDSEEEVDIEDHANLTPVHTEGATSDASTAVDEAARRNARGVRVSLFCRAAEPVTDVIVPYSRCWLPINFRRL